MGKQATVILPDPFGWVKVSDLPAPTGGVLAYDDESDHMFICDTLFDIRSFTHWQRLPHYPGDAEAVPYTIAWSTGYCGKHYHMKG